VNRFILRLCFVLSLSPGLFIASAHAQPRTKPVSLFTDKDTSAWELITLPANAVTTPAWHFDSYGVLAVTGKPVSYLVTKASYSNYRLHVEWRWPVGAAKNSNSGVLLHITSGPTNDSPWPVCFQTAKFTEKLTTPPEAKTPQLDRLVRDSERPLGEWNVCDIVCVGDSIEVTVNGVLQNRVTQCSPSAGRVGIQLEGTPYELRNIRLLPPK
jgi:Domain of Unknown Function (DUF1080)